MSEQTTSRTPQQAMADAKDFAAPDAIWRPAPKPEPPKWRAWTSDEVPLGAWVRQKDRNRHRVSDLRCMIVTVGLDAFTIVSGDLQHPTFEGALKSLEHSTDGGKTWLPCGVEVKP